ncbi:urate hydroxylase PuuD [Halomonas llamarensis]|uniref:Urate hydroxylase PuuD n=1 Tax=Halomonas llamarensis TaxID=2945104 RepID=A0ABT0SSF4_9GAMM|nr:urate hydroxylase PuuD [Halomonas llamarensis]MCL7930760.1 urate hydroxylase PuuD [Halomonas llamarensis]
MQAYFIEFGNFMLRWLHVIAAIAWIGESIYFVMLDNGLKTPKAAEDREKGVFGEMWAVHGGGFYHNQKYATAPDKLPNDLHWSFWKAYTTWLSGFALFIILYMVNPGFYLVNPNSDWEWAANMTGWQANILALVFLLLGWVVYNEMCKRISPNMERDGLLSIGVAIMMVVVAYLSTQLFSGRAAFLLTGAVMATAMSANVFFWIIPGQRRMVKAMKAGETPNPLDGKRGKQRSVHNTYFTLPVVLLMISNHYSFAYSHEHAWVLMTLFIFAGALIRQYFVLMHQGKIRPAYPVVGVALILIAFWVGMPSSSSAPTGEQTAGNGPKITEIKTLMNKHCVACHSQTPTQPGFSAPPAGLAYDNIDQILLQKDKIQRVVKSGYMPLGNMTNMTERERAVIQAWKE